MSPLCRWDGEAGALALTCHSWAPSPLVFAAALVPVGMLVGAQVQVQADCWLAGAHASSC